MRRSRSLLLAALLVSAAGTAFAQTAPQRHPWTHPDTLRVGFQVEPNTLNPLLAGNTSESAIGRLMFDVLVTVDSSGHKEIPVLAAEVPTLENGGISKDGLTITYKLRRNVLWHDGIPFTSKDVKFTFDAIMSNQNNVISRTGYELVRSVDTPSDDRVVFHLKRRFSPFVNTVFGESDSPYEIVPAHLLEKLPNINQIPFNASPIGTGPFKFKEWAHGDHITLVPNEKYFLGRPKLKEIILKFIPDESTEINQLRTHEIDWQFEPSPDQYAELLSIPDIKTLLIQQNQYEQIQMNTQRPFLNEVAVRRAIAYAIDSRALVQQLTFGSAQVADQDLPPFMWAHASDVERYPFDPTKAKALLTQAGFSSGPDGVLTRGGKRLSLEIVTNNSNVTRRRAVVLVQAMLHKVGIEVHVHPYLGQMLFATKGQGGVLQNGRFDLSWTGWIAGIDPDNSSVFMCSALPPNGNNTMFYCNPRVDAAEHAALDNYAVPARKAAYATIEQVVSEQRPVIFVWWPRQTQPINPDLHGFAPNPVSETWNAYEWEI